MINIDWQNIKVHPAAEEFPRMVDAEVADLAADIRTNGLALPLVVWVASNDEKDEENEVYLLDGRNRLKAIQLLGHKEPGQVPRTGGKTGLGYEVVYGTMHSVAWGNGSKAASRPVYDPWLYSTSLNLKRRHLNTDQKREIIAKALTRFPDMSARAIAKGIGVDDKTVGKVRKEMQAAEVGGVRNFRTPPTRVEVAAEAIRSNPDLSERQVAAKAGVTRSTVRDAKKKLAAPPAPKPVAKPASPAVKASVPAQAAKPDIYEEAFNAAVVAAVETIRNRARLGGIGAKDMPRFVAAIVAALEA